MQTTGTRSIEVSAAIGDSVVSVHQLGSPRAGKISTATKTLLASAVVALVCSLGAFAHGVSVAAENSRELKKWVEVDKLPAVEFRAVRMSPLFDVMAVGGLLSGVGLLGWAMARAHAERRSPWFRIGRTSEAEFATDDVPVGVQAFPLVAPAGDDYVFSWAPGMKGEMFTGGKLVPLAEVPQGAAIPLDARIRVESGPMTFHITSSPGSGYAVGAAPMDGRVYGFAGISGAAHGILLILMFMQPDNVKGHNRDDLDDDMRNARIRMPAMEAPKPVETMKADDKGADRVLAGDAGQKLTGKEGTMGKPDAARDAKGGYRMKDNGVDPTLAKERAVTGARSSGVLGALRSAQGGTFSHITGTHDFSSGLDDDDVYGGLIGEEAGLAWGNYGYGINGDGPGGGGTGLNTVGTNYGYGTIGRCTGEHCGKGPGWGADPGGLMVRKTREARVPPTIIGRAVLKGDMDASMIRQRIRQRLERIQYCYEHELMGNASLHGTVNTQFTIDGKGKVIGIVANGVSSEVSECVGNVIKGIQFPVTGQIVQVTSYPFRFTNPAATVMRGNPTAQLR